MTRICRSESGLSRVWQGRAEEWHRMCDLASVIQKWHVSMNVENVRVVAGGRHGMCELDFNAAEEQHVCANQP
jgi:hypothetical protein